VPGGETQFVRRDPNSSHARDVMTLSESCQLCGGTELQVISEQLRGGRSGIIQQCAQCGLVFKKQDTSSREVYDFYVQNYPGNYQYRTELNKHRMELLGASLASHMDVLEIGCSSGEFLDLVRPRVRSVAGVELVPHDVEKARTHYGLTVYDRPVEQLSLDGQFDLIMTFQTFEHIPAPNEFLGCLRRMLKPKGRMIVEVPNVNEPLYALYRLEVFRGFYFVPQHLFYYSQETLPRMLAKNGFAPGMPRLIQMGTLTNHLHWIHAQGPQRDLAEVCSVVLPKEVDSPEVVDLFKAVNKFYQDALVARGYSDVLWIEASADPSYCKTSTREDT
jgi:2-polyprenyl-3-methyl-5-hydroxy-6-metoxy-1,4-benzoquinol methylase